MKKSDAFEVAAVVWLLGICSLPTLSHAQAITTATGLANTVNVADAVGAVFIVAGVLLLAGVALMGARMILRKFAMDLEDAQRLDYLDEVLFEHGADSAAYRHAAEDYWAWRG